MKIAFDARALRWAGIGRYVRNLLRELLLQNSDEHTFTVLLGKSDVPTLTSLLKGISPTAWSYHLVNNSHYSFAEQLLLPVQLWSVDADVFHFAHFNVPLTFRKPYVVTIHDVTRFIFPGERKSSLLHQYAYEYIFSSAVAHASRIISVSQATSRELTLLPLKLSATITTIPEAVAPLFFKPILPAERQAVRQLIGTDDPYILFVGVWMQHKNIDRLLEAFNLVAIKHPRLRLVLAGRQPANVTELTQQVVPVSLLPRITFLNEVADALLPALFAESICYAMISLYEGFGLPALEAAACGTPVVASNVASLPEVMGESAFYVNPEYVPDIADALESVVTDGALRHKMIQAGREQTASFSWRRAAISHLRLYEQAVDGTP